MSSSPAQQARGTLGFRYYVLIVGALLCAKVLLARGLVLGHALGLGALADVLSIVAILALTSSLKGSLARRALAVSTVVVSVVAFVTVVYASYFDQIPGVSALRLSGQAARLGGDGFAVLSWVHLLFLIDLPLVLWLGFKGGKRTEVGTRMSVIGIGALLAVIAFTLSAVALPLNMGGLRSSYRYGIVAYELSSLLPSRVAAESGTPVTHGAIQNRIDELTGRRDLGRDPLAPVYGTYQGKNLIMVQMEALQTGLIGARVNGQAVVPFLEYLVNRSTYYPNMYSQIGRGNTSDAEFMVNTSLYPCGYQASSLQYAGKEIPGLPRLLNGRGYETFTFHTNRAEFWNRWELYPALGFKRFFDRDYFGEVDVVGYGPTDSVLYSRALDVLEQMQAQGNPFYAHIVTVSAHYPFRPIAPRGYLRLPPEVLDTETGAYLQAQSYADMQLGAFIGALETSGLLDNSILVVYGDHFGMRFNDVTETDRKFRQTLYGHRYNRADFYNVPLVIHLPGQDEAVRDPKVLGQIDIMPTVADLLGVSLAKTPHFGRSAYERTPTLLTRPSSIPTYIDDEVMFLGGVTEGEDRMYSSTTKAMLPDPTRPDRMQATVDLMNLSDRYVMELEDRPGGRGRRGVIPIDGKDIQKTPFR